MKTEIIKSMNWHTVKFTIWVQTFSLAECVKDNQWWSLAYARMLKRMLDKALSKLKYIDN